MTVKEFYDKYGETEVLAGIQPGLRVNYLTIRTEGNRIFVQDDHGDCGLDDSEREIADVVTEWITATETEDDGKLELWFHPAISKKGTDD